MSLEKRWKRIENKDVRSFGTTVFGESGTSRSFPFPLTVFCPSSNAKSVTIGGGSLLPSSAVLLTSTTADPALLTAATGGATGSPSSGGP